MSAPDEELVYRYDGPPAFELRRWLNGAGGWMHRWDQQDRLPGVVVIATDGSGVAILRQWRENVGRELWQLPRGFREPADGDELAAATRELAEETGLVPVVGSKPRLVGRIWTDPGITSTGVDVVEVDVMPSSVATAGDGEGIRQVRFLPLDSIGDWVGSGLIEDGITLAALARYLLGRAGSQAPGDVGGGS